MDLVILAGGKGSRIKHMNPYLPKPMIKFNKVSFLQLLINHYSKFDIENIYILAGYKGQIIKKKFHNKIQNFVKIKCLIEKKPMDTAGALNLVKKKIKDDFVLINGDTYLDINDINDLKIEANKRNKIGCLVLIKSNKKNIKFNNLFIDKNHNIIRKDKSKYINAGIYYFKKKIFKFIENKKLSIENTILPNFIKKKMMTGIKLNNFFLDIGTPIDLKKAKIELIKHLKKPSIFLDRDGVINHDKGYTHKFSDFKFRKNVINFLGKISKEKRYIFIITNQGGIAKNKYTLKNFQKLHIQIKKYLSSKKIFINDVEFCPHHPRGVIKKYSIKCRCRKPSNMMLRNIEKRWLLNKQKSFFIGDQLKDKLAAKKSNLKFYYVKEDILQQLFKV
jgi:mannose-1-phosphate guanylyltransferase / phosphomannomutase